MRRAVRYPTIGLVGRYAWVPRRNAQAYRAVPADVEVQGRAAAPSHGVVAAAEVTSLGGRVDTSHGGPMKGRSQCWEHDCSCR